MARSECLYDLLGVADDATDDELKRAYREAARLHHPDVNPDAEPGRFGAVASAYDVLRDPARRRAYDATRAWERGVGAGRGGPTGAGHGANAWGGFEEYARGFAERHHRGHATETEWQRRERMARAAAERAEMEREFWIQEKARARHMAVEYRRRAAKAKHSRALRHEATIRGFWFSKRGWLPMDLVALFTATAFAGGSLHVWRESGRHKLEARGTMERRGEERGRVDPRDPREPSEPVEVAAAAVKEGDARDR